MPPEASGVRCDANHSCFGLRCTGAALSRLMRLQNPQSKCDFVGILVTQSVDDEIQYLSLVHSHTRNVKTLRPPVRQLSSCQGRTHLIN